MKCFFVRSLTTAIVALFLLNCSGRQIQSEPMTPRTAPEVAPIAEHDLKGSGSDISVEGLRAQNLKANRPTFGIIKGFYQLPESFPGGAISAERARGFGFDYQSVTISRLGTKPYVIMPASAEESEAISSAMNQMLDAGIRFVEVSLADATKIISAEKAALAGKSMIFPGSSVPSGVDALLSIEKGFGTSGPIYLGRVIRTKDGQLFALATEPDVGPYSMSPLITRLIKDSLGRMASQK